MKQVSPTYFPPKQSTGPRCCNTGHPILADPLTGRTVCSCQLNTGLPAYLSRVPSLPETVYSHVPTKVPNGSIVGDHSSPVFYPRYAGDNPVTSLKPSAPATLHPYYIDQLMATNPYGALYPGFDINGARRKNTNREATGPLKAWIYQHRKNPYPTKGEKVMLAIISQMTLTQVSTWFANARRRLKKESKIDDTDIDLADIDIDDPNILNSSSSERLADSDSESSANHCNISRSTSEISDISDCEEPTPRDIKPSKSCAQSLFSPDGRTELYLERISSPSDLSPCSASRRDNYVFHGNSKTETDVRNSPHADGATHKTEDTIHASQEDDVFCAVHLQNKPKIWSIVDMIG